MLVADNHVELLTRQGWTYHAFRPVVEEGGDGWAIAIEKEKYRIIVFADTYERACVLAAKVVEERSRAFGRRLAPDQPW
jgi:hypothetical protein